MVERTQNGEQKKAPLSRKKKILLALVVLVVLLIVIFGYRLYKNWATKDETKPAVETTAVMKEQPKKDNGKTTTSTKSASSSYDDETSSSTRVQTVKKPVVKIAFVLPLSGATPDYAQYVKRQILSSDVPADSKYEYQILVEDGGKNSDSASAKASDMVDEYSVDAVVVLRPDAKDVVKITASKGIIPVSISYVMDRYMTAAESKIIRDPVALLVDVFEQLPAKDGKKPEREEIAKALKNYKNALQAGLPAKD